MSHFIISILFFCLSPIITWDGGHYLHYLPILNGDEKFENWDRKIWNAINILNDEQYINFWIYQGVLSVSIQYNNYDFNPLIRDYYLCTGRYEFESPTTFRDYQPIVISKMVSRLNKLENEGYHFKCGKDKQYKLID